MNARPSCTPIRSTLLVVATLLATGCTSYGGPPATGDASTRDAATLDSGPIDLGAEDASLDASLDAMTDAAPDATTDAMIDAPWTTDGGCRLGDPESCPPGSSCTIVGPGSECAPMFAPSRFADVLFVIDNSGSMDQEQASLGSAIPDFVRALATGDVLDDDDEGDPTTLDDNFPPFEGVNFGVVTTDLGTGGTLVQTCNLQPDGEDGLLRNIMTRGCGSVDSGIVAWSAPAAPSATAASLSCLANVGTNGCGFEQQLEAMLLALDGRNTGFVRESDSTLIVIVITDENDCSNNPSASHFFDGTDATVEDTNLNVRCAVFEDRLYAASRYVEALNTLASTRPVVFGVISGMPSDIVPSPDVVVRPSTIDSILDDEAMEITVDPASGNSLIPACSDPVRGRADPARRLLDVAKGFTGGVAIESICTDDYSNFIRSLGYRIGALR